MSLTLVVEKGELFYGEGEDTEKHFPAVAVRAVDGSHDVEVDVVVIVDELDFAADAPAVLALPASAVGPFHAAEAVVEGVAIVVIDMDVAHAGVALVGTGLDVTVPDDIAALLAVGSDQQSVHYKGYRRSRSADCPYSLLVLRASYGQADVSSYCAAECHTFPCRVESAPAAELDVLALSGKEWAIRLRSDGKGGDGRQWDPFLPLVGPGNNPRYCFLLEDLKAKLTLFQNWVARLPSERQPGLLMRVQ